MNLLTSPLCEIPNEIPYCFFHLKHLKNRYAEAYRNEMVSFVECAHAQKPSPVGVADGRAAYLIGKAAKQSMETGMVRDEETVTMRAQNRTLALFFPLCRFKEAWSTLIKSNSVVWWKQEEDDKGQSGLRAACLPPPSHGVFRKQYAGYVQKFTLID